MRLQRTALNIELPAAATLSVEELCARLAMLGFPVDGVEATDFGTVLDVDVTANRGDALSVRGLARELAASLGAELTLLPIPAFTEGPEGWPIRLEAGEACPLYAAALLRLGEGPGVPEEAQAFLKAAGINPKLWPAVDASNELLQRYNHPTHAFDADKLQGPIRVRWARMGETITCLDAVERNLSSEDLVIADDSGPIALAGLMGGDSTKVDENTQRILVESAYFDPARVRAMSLRHKLVTDASQRFGRGVDRVMPRVARSLLAQRLADWAGAHIEAVWTVGSEASAPKNLPLSLALLHRICGFPVSLDEAVQALRSLGCGVQVRDNQLAVDSPTWRHDLNIAEDLAEEVLRLMGYERLGSELPPAIGRPMPQNQDFLHRLQLARRLAHHGFFQTLTFGFVGPELDTSPEDVEERTLANPLGRDHSILRASLLPSLRAAAEHNIRQGQKEVRLFEIAPIFHGSPEGPVEVMCLALLWGGEQGGLDPLSPKGAVHPAALQGLLKALGGDAPIQKLGDQLFALELPLSQLPPLSQQIIPLFKGFSRYPAVERDLSFVVPSGRSFAELSQAIREALANAPLQSLSCVDIFRGKGLPEGHQAWLLRFVFQSDRTLIGEEVDAWMQRVLDAAQVLGIKLRA